MLLLRRKIDFRLRADIVPTLCDSIIISNGCQHHKQKRLTIIHATGLNDGKRDAAAETIQETHVPATYAVHNLACETGPGFLTDNKTLARISKQADR